MRGREHGLALLAWYDRARRLLPWRAAPGARQDAYRVWLSEIMLQQTTVKAVAPYYARFLARWPDVQSLAAASLGDVLKTWAGLGYYARARNLHACAKVVAARHAGRFPAQAEALSLLPGIGPYTAAAIAAIAFEQRALAIDGNAERVIARLFAIEEKLPAAKAEIKRRAETLLPPRRFGDFAQGLMDLGATLCTPKSPACARCPWRADCAAHARGEEEAFPRKARKRAGQLRRGAAFVAARADGAVLLRTRAPKGLLGGMTEVPGTAWAHDFDVADALEHAPRVSGCFGKTKRRSGKTRAYSTPTASDLPLIPAQAGIQNCSMSLRMTAIASGSPLARGRAEKKERFNPIENCPNPRRSGKTKKGEVLWRPIPGVVRHVFTHFPLVLVVFSRVFAAKTPAPKGMRWVARAELAGEALPSVMRKVLAHAGILEGSRAAGSAPKS